MKKHCYISLLDLLYHGGEYCTVLEEIPKEKFIRCTKDGSVIKVLYKDKTIYQRDSSPHWLMAEDLDAARNVFLSVAS